MNVTRNVIDDLLPAYLSGEASPDTVALVDEFLRQDPELARTVEATARQSHGGAARSLATHTRKGDL